MSQLEKLLNRLKEKPNSIKFPELEKILQKKGFIRRKQRSGSSHYTYKHPKLTLILTIPKHGLVDICYIKQVIDALDKLEEQS